MTLEQRAYMCEECMSETCAYVYKGVCHYPLIFESQPLIHDDGCDGYVYSEQSKI